MKFFGLTYRILFLLFCFLFCNIIVGSANGKIQNDDYHPNPGVGCYQWYKHARVDSFPLNHSNKKINYAASVYARLCWKDMVREGKNRMNSLDALFDTAYNRKVRVDIGVFHSLSMRPEKRFRLRNEQYHGKNIYIAYPEELHDQLISSKKHKPRLVYVPDTDTYWYCIDWRNPLARIEYKKLLYAFNDYLNEPWKRTTRRKYMNSIQIRFWGFWGEGANNYLIAQNKGHDKAFEDSKTMIEMDNYYIKLFHDIRLIAPAMGKTANIPDRWKEWVMYELTAHNDVGELGIFIDHISKCSKGDFTLKYKGLDTREIALNKWRRAPVTGEGNIINNVIPGRGEGTYVQDTFPINQYDVSKYHISSFLPMKRHYTIEEADILETLIRRAGFKLFFMNPRVHFSDKQLHINIEIVNMGLSPVYSNYWKLQFIIRDVNGKEVEIINPKIDLTRIQPGKKMQGVSAAEDFFIVNQIFNVTHRGEIYLRIVDQDGISANMYLYNEGRTTDGEYRLD
jgi:hypothetical protein